MAIQTTINRSVNIAGGAPISTTETVSSDGAPLYNLTVLPGMNNQYSVIAMAMAKLQSLFIVSNQAVTMKFNGTDAIQTVTISGGVTGGTFTLTYAGQTTTAIAWNATAAAVQAALVALSSIGAANVSVAGPAGGPWVVTFIGTLGVQVVTLMTFNIASLTGGTPAMTIVTTTAGVVTTQTFALQAGISFPWTAQAGYFPNPVTSDVVAIRFSNTGTTQANIQILLGLNV